MRQSFVRHIAILTALLIGLGAPTTSAQEQPVVLIHGVASGPDTWQEATDRLQSGLRVNIQRAEVSWWNSLEFQSSEMQNRFGGLPNSTIAIGHSLGGLVARQWSRSHELDGIVTLGTPNRGAPIANHINEWVGFNAALFNAVGNAVYALSGLSYDRWWWLGPAVEAALNWGASISNFSIYHLLIELGMQ